MDRDTRRRVVFVPLALWVGLIVLLAITAVYANVGAAPGKGIVNIAIAIGMWLVIAVMLMQLRRSAALIRLTAIAGLVWGSFLFILTFADLLTR